MQLVGELEVGRLGKLRTSIQQEEALGFPQLTVSRISLGGSTTASSETAIVVACSGHGFFSALISQSLHELLFFGLVLFVRNEPLISQGG